MCMRVLLVWKEYMVSRRVNAYMKEGCMLVVQSLTTMLCCTSRVESLRALCTTEAATNNHNS